MGRRRSWNPSEQVIVEIIAPFQKFIKETVNITEKLWLKYFGLISAHNENVRMKGEIDSLRMENFRYRELLATHQRLQKLLQFKKTIELTLI